MHVNSYESPLKKPSTVCTYWIKEKGLYTSDDSFDNDSAFIPTQPRVEGAGEDEGADQKMKTLANCPKATLFSRVCPMLCPRQKTMLFLFHLSQENHV